MNNTKEQCFMHVATYRLADLRIAGTTSSADLGPDVFEDELTPALVNILNARLTSVCEVHGWQVVDISAFPDRVEAFITGMEPEGENGETVARALDEAVYSGMSTRAAAAMH